MREIKFRAWDFQNNSMFYPHEIYFDGGLKNIGALDAMANYIENGRPRFVLMQYTGLKDKNGKEIYEGDIIVVRVLHDGDECCWDNEKQEPIPQLVKWDERRCSFDFGHASRICYYPHHFEVIGNIFENPELLKKGDKNGYVIKIHKDV